MNNVETKTLMQTIVDTYHLQAGTREDPLMHPQDIKYTDAKWMQEFLRAMRKYRVTISRPETLTLPLQRENDVNLMDKMIELGVGDIELRRINICRQYLQVLTLADITDENGKKINTKYFLEKQHESSLQWAEVPRPPEITWKSWKRAIIEIFCRQKSSRDLKQEYILGKWLIPIEQLHKKWNFMHSEETQSIYQRMHNGYKMYFSNTHGRHIIETSNEANDWTKVPPNDALPITQITEKKFEIHHEFRFCPSMSKSVLTWRDFVNNLNEYEKVMLQNITVLKPTEFLQALESQTELYVCSDGALKNDKSGGGFVIADKEETIYVTGFNPDTGHLFFQTSYRSEAQAGYVVFLFLTRLCQFQCIKQPTIKYYCDNKGLIVRLNNKIETQRKNDIEIIQLINNVTSNNQEYNHVYGHRNEMTLSMSTQEYLNTIADKIASNNRTTPQQIHHPSLLAVYVNKQYVPHNVPNFLLKHMYEEEAEEFMCSKYKWNKQECRQILWYQHKEVINTNIYNKRKFYIKYIHNRLPIGTLNFETTNRCPYCNIRENEII